MATKITFQDKSSPFVLVYAEGHAKTKEVCAIITHTLLILWAFTGANGDWKGPTGGAMHFSVPNVHVAVLRMVYLSLYTLAKTYPDELSVENGSWLLKDAEQVPESNVPIGELAALPPQDAGHIARDYNECG